MILLAGLASAAYNLMAHLPPKVFVQLFVYVAWKEVQMADAPAESYLVELLLIYLCKVSPNANLNIGNFEKSLSAPTPVSAG